MSRPTCFPDGFLWGAATSAYQIEGSPLADGAGPSDWHEFSHRPGAIADGTNGDLVCDHYRRFEDDVGLMKELGLNAYRFSVSWSRVLPEGRGRVNGRGLEFYQRLIDRLRERDIQPHVTLFHWDLPLALARRGGWAWRDCAGWFADYAQHMFRALGDRVSFWATLNEPWVVVDAGYVSGSHPPGRIAPRDAPHVAHNLLRGHALAVQAFRAAPHAGQIGLVVNLEPKHPASSSPEDVHAAARASAYMNELFLDPVLRGRYSERLPQIVGGDWPEFSEEDLRLIAEPVDFIGVNYYSRSVTRHDPGRPPACASAVRQAGAEHTAMGWEVFPRGLTEILCWVTSRYGRRPIHITENGAAFEDPPPEGGSVDDPRRVAYYHRHLRAALEALAAGVDLRGYFAWSFLDNFEWSHGTSKRFGLVHVDYATQRRTLKRSASFYRDVIASRGAALCGDGILGLAEADEQSHLLSCGPPDPA